LQQPPVGATHALYGLLSKFLDQAHDASGDPQSGALVWLLEDLVLWLIETDRIKSFRPRRN